MVPETLLALFLAGRALLPDALASPGEAVSGTQVTEARYEAGERAVTNWRSQAVEALEPKAAIALVTLLGAERPVVTRCVKLNNYWCIKSARWNGEIATDNEGHVGFVSADHGADAAATLLRRYYLDFGRKSALAIVRRWAPAECNIATGIGGVAVLAVKGIGGTVRARYLASRRGKGRVRYTAKARPGGKSGRVSMVIPMAPKTPRYRVPDIASGMGEKQKAEPRRPPRAAARPQPGREPAATASVAPKAAVTACAPDEQRLRNYASRMVEGLNLGPEDDLKLFAENGTPQPNLAHVMLAMSAFELGALRASPDLVERAILRAGAKAEAAATTAKGGLPQGSAQ
ncbi:hypothetical protein [Microvirga roseola]|uniref:hypothetical protein n=1 Tax=Microvirga roseola TaxID=2883126 RepID=UPI001E34C425|nr:hypothetical protein [Microvirga roseola]